MYSLIFLSLILRKFELIYTFLSKRTKYNAIKKTTQIDSEIGKPHVEKYVLKVDQYRLMEPRALD